MRNLLILACVLAPIAGCTSTHQGRLTKLSTGQQNTVVFREAAVGDQVDVDAVLVDGEQCHGRFNTVADQVDRDFENPSNVISEESQVGVAVLKCSANHIVKCEFSREIEGDASGHCLDNLGQKYSLNF
jgi:hypothetical protein